MATFFATGRVDLTASDSVSLPDDWGRSADRIEEPVAQGHVSARPFGTTFRPRWYHDDMAMNLRLRPEAAAALKAESERTGRSQQEILRQAVDEHLGLATRRQQSRLPDWVIPASEPYRRVEPSLVLPEGMTLVEFIDRQEDRV